MALLAFDTSSDRGSVAIADGPKILSEKTWDREGSHGELLTPAIEFCLREAGLEAKKLDALAIGRGPGSFTGVRVAVNAARALGFALGLPVHAFDSSEILLAQARRPDLPVAILINAYKNLLFASTFAVAECGSRRKVLPLDAYELSKISPGLAVPHVAIGDGFAVYESAMSPGMRSMCLRDPKIDDFPSAVTIAGLARDPKLSRPMVWKDIQALYIRASGAEENLSSK